MRRLSSALAVVLSLAACGSPEPAGVTSTTTSAPEATSTTSSPDRSSTTTTATTTTIPPTTTTLLDGDWADEPVVTYPDWGGLVLGWWDGEAWVQAEEGMTVPVQGGEDYQIALLGSEGSVTGGAAEDTGCDVLLVEGLPAITLNEPDLVRSDEGLDRTVNGVALSAGWDLTPHQVSAGESHPDLEAVAAQLLQERGYVEEHVAIVQVVDADLDGDGAIETIVVAEDTELANEGSGVYSIVFVVTPMRDGALVVEESVIPPTETGYPGSFRVSAVADLSGDGLMEVVLDGIGWETSWVQVHELTSTGFEARLSAGCGV